MRYLLSLQILVVCILFESLSGSQAQAKTVFVGRKTDLSTVLSQPNNKYILFYDYDLNGDTIKLGNSSSLLFRGGSIRNGILVGDNTSIKASKRSEIFSNILIDGSWNCPKVYSTWFADINDANRIGALFALTSDKSYNTVYIKKGCYYIKLDTYDSTPFKPRSKTHIILEGTILQNTNNMTEYYTVFLDNVSDVKITGTGEIIGDKKIHPNSITGEKGHGIAIRNCRNILIDGITVKDCWGDCIYVGFSATNHNIRINGCRIENGRRTGIAVVNADGFEIKNCTISSIEGTPTEYGIDIEPNVGSSHVCKNGLIEDNQFSTKYGLYIQSQEKSATNSIVVTNNKFTCSKRAITLSGGEGISVVRNTIDSDVALFYTRIGDIELSSIIENNTIKGTIRGNVKGQRFVENTINGICYFEDGCEGVSFTGNHCYGLVNFAKGVGGNLINENTFEFPLEVRTQSTLEDNTFKDVVSLTNCVIRNNNLYINNPKMERQNVVVALDNCIFEYNTVNVDLGNQSHIKSVFGFYNKPSVIKDNIIEGEELVKAMLEADDNIKRTSSFSNNRFGCVTIEL